MLTRRSLLAGGALPIFGQAPAGDALPIVTARLGEPVPYRDSHGDVWTATWAEDGELYVVSDDTEGFGKACKSNLAFHRLTGAMPPDLHGTTINPMAEYGKSAELSPKDGASWKASGLASIDGVIYMGVSRHRYPDERLAYAHFIQETWDGSVIKSVDKGKSWSAAPEVGRPMFPGRMFSNPYFVHYGQDGKGPKDWVYCVSNDGAWNNGNAMTLGRVPRARLARLDAGDWEFFHGFDKDGGPQWTKRLEEAMYTFHAPGRTSMTGVHYIEALDVYVMPQWSYDYSKMDPANGKSRWGFTNWEFYQARAPWGPWKLFYRAEFFIEGFYNPNIPAKFISRDGKKMWVFTASYSPAMTYYRLHMVPLTLMTRA